MPSEQTIRYLMVKRFDKLLLLVHAWYSGMKSVIPGVLVGKKTYTRSRATAAIVAATQQLKQTEHSGRGTPRRYTTSKRTPSRTFPATPSLPPPNKNASVRRSCSSPDTFITTVTTVVYTVPVPVPRTHCQFVGSLIPMTSRTASRPIPALT